VGEFQTFRLGFGEIVSKNIGKGRNIDFIWNEPFCTRHPFQCVEYFVETKSLAFTPKRSCFAFYFSATAGFQVQQSSLVIGNIPFLIPWYSCCPLTASRRIVWRTNMKEKIASALAASNGTVSLAGELTVHRLGFGAMRITGDGIWGPPKDPASALAVLRRATELGVNFIDTADSYGPYVSEELIAKALAPYPKDLVIATKGGWNRPGPGQWTHDASPEHLRKAVEGSLKRLRLERIDVYQLHVPDPVVPFDVSMETLAELQAEGKIRFVALSNVTKEHIERARKIVPIVSVQNRYSFADREWDYVVDYCERNGIAFIPWSPLGSGKVGSMLLDRLAQTHKKTPMQVALAWLLKRSPVMLPIPGTSSIEHLEENVQAASLRLTDEEYQELSGVTELASRRYPPSRRRTSVNA
jgi:pyridoxine 4-dehydrogenase